MNVQFEIERLRSELHEHNHRYYTLDAPTVSDYEFDQLLKKLEQLDFFILEKKGPSSTSLEVRSKQCIKTSKLTPQILWLF